MNFNTERKIFAQAKILNFFLALIIELNDAVNAVSMIVTATIAFGIKYSEEDMENIMIMTATKIESNTFNNVVTNYQVFKYENTNKYEVKVSWKLNLWYNGVCRACDLPSPNEYEMKLELNAGEVKIGNAKSESKIFAVFQSSEGMAPLDKFEFENLIILAKK